MDSHAEWAVSLDVSSVSFDCRKLNSGEKIQFPLVLRANRTYKKIYGGLKGNKYSVEHAARCNVQCIRTPEQTDWLAEKVWPQFDQTLDTQANPDGDEDIVDNPRKTIKSSEDAERELKRRGHEFRVTYSA